jgi:hypothetical protein
MNDRSKIADIQEITCQMERIDGYRSTLAMLGDGMEGDAGIATAWLASQLQNLLVQLKEAASRSSRRQQKGRGMIPAPNPAGPHRIVPRSAVRDSDASAERQECDR